MLTAAAEVLNLAKEKGMMTGYFLQPTHSMRDMHTPGKTSPQRDSWSCPPPEERREGAPGGLLSYCSELNPAST